MNEDCGCEIDRGPLGLAQPGEERIIHGAECGPRTPLEAAAKEMLKAIMGILVHIDCNRGCVVRPSRVAALIAAVAKAEGVAEEEA